MPPDRRYATFASLSIWYQAGLSFQPNGTMVQTRSVPAYDSVKSGQLCGYRSKLWKPERLSNSSCSPFSASISTVTTMSMPSITWQQVLWNSRMSMTSRGFEDSTESASTSRGRFGPAWSCASAYFAT